MNQFGILLFIILASGTIQAQWDTIELKKLVPTSKEIFAHKHFWDYIHQRDQEMRKSPIIETIDRQNLILVSYYFNTFGYPDYRSIGGKANIINMVWVHNNSYDVKKLTAPIIIEGYNQQGIPEDSYRDYYLRILYQRKSEDHGYKTKPLDTIYNELGIHPANRISIKGILNGFVEFDLLRSDTALIIGNWLTPEIIDTNVFQGKMLISTIKGTRVQIFQTSNQNFYLRYYYSDNSGDPIELEKSLQHQNIFKEKKADTARYYEITDEGNLMYNNPTYSIQLEYKKIEQ